MTLRLIQYASRALDAFYRTIDKALGRAHWASMSDDDREAARLYPDG